MRSLLRLAAAFGMMAWLAAGALAHEYKVGELEIVHPHARAMIPGTRLGAGYLEVINHGKTDDRLVSATVERAGKVQLHEMTMDNNVMKMREIKGGIVVPAGQTVVLKPGGLHVMFMDVSEAYKEGESIKATLVFEKAGSVDIEFQVGPASGKDAMHKGDASGDDPQHAIPAVLKAIFETPDNPLTVAPVVVSGDWAIAGWVQGERGGRALMKNGHHGWSVHLCSGDGLKDAVALEKIGIPADQASRLAADLALADSKLDAKTLALFSSFEGTVMMDAHAGHGAKQDPVQ